MNLLALVPVQYRVGAVAVLCAAVYGYGWLHGVEHELSKQKAISDNRQVLILTAKLKQADISEKEVVRYVDRIQTIKIQGDTIIKEVPIFITKDVDDRCIIPIDFGLLWNAINDSNHIP